MTDEEYRAAIAEFKNDHLEHGSEWKIHKYIKKIGDKYFYKTDQKKSESTVRNLSEEEAEAKRKEAEARQKGREAVKSYDRKAEKDWVEVEKERISYKNSRKESDKKFEESIQNLPEEAKKRAIAEREKQVKETDAKKEESLNKETFRREQKREFTDPISKSWGNMFANAVKENDQKRIKQFADEFIKLCSAQRDNYLDHGYTESEADAEITELLLLTEYEYQSKLGNFGSGSSNISDDFDLKRTVMSRIEEGRKKNVTGTGKGIYKREKANVSGPVGQVKHSFDHSEDFYAAVYDYKKEHKIKHHGILGQKWGIRRYQNPDGTLTDLGKKHQGKLDKIDAKIEKLDSKTWKKMAKYAEKNGTTVGYDLTKDRAWKRAEKLLNKKALLSVKAHANDKLADMYDKDPECKSKIDSLIRANKARRMNEFSTQFLFGIPGSVVYQLITAPFEAKNSTRAYVSDKAREAFDKAASESDYGKRVSANDKEKYARKAGYDYRR